MLKDFSHRFKGKSIDPVYRLMRLTQTFGPCGIGWQFVQTSQWSEELDGKSVCFVKGYLRYRIDLDKDEWYSTNEHTGGTVAMGKAPDEAYKMSETDALGKACLDLGLAADVYLGLHDSDKYQRIEALDEAFPQHYANILCPYGSETNGKRLGELTDSQLSFFANDWNVNPNNTEDVQFQRNVRGYLTEKRR